MKYSNPHFYFQQIYAQKPANILLPSLSRVVQKKQCVCVSAHDLHNFGHVYAVPRIFDEEEFRKLNEDSTLLIYRLSGFTLVSARRKTKTHTFCADDWPRFCYSRLLGGFIKRIWIMFPNAHQTGADSGDRNGWWARPRNTLLRSAAPSSLAYKYIYSVVHWCA